MLSVGKENDVADGLVAAAYAPCEVHTAIRGTAIHVVEETDYLFCSAVRLTISPASPLRFSLQLRIPGWAAGSALRVNGQAEPALTAGSFARMERTWKHGDRVEIDFPLEVRNSRWFHDSIALERGPLVFSYGIGEDWVRLRNHGMGSADWQIFPTTQRSYALELDPQSPASSVFVSEMAVTEGSFTAAHTPVGLTVKARKLPDWRAEDGVTNPLPAGPVASDQAEETITLTPYSAAKLRITSFPHCKPRPTVAVLAETESY